VCLTPGHTSEECPCFVDFEVSAMTLQWQFWPLFLQCNVKAQCNCSRNIKSRIAISITMVLVYKCPININSLKSYFLYILQYYSNWLLHFFWEIERIFTQCVLPLQWLLNDPNKVYISPSICVSLQDIKHSIFLYCFLM
jgi:hypothetical protein